MGATQNFENNVSSFRVGNSVLLIPLCVVFPDFPVLFNACSINSVFVLY